jgi:hypothetical protein
MQKFFLRRRVLDPQKSFEISQEKYKALADARTTLVDAFAFEQKFELLLGNYRDLELAAAKWALARVIETLNTYSQFGTIMTEANRLVVNLLSTARLYGDQVKRAFSNLKLDRTFKTIATERLATAYDSSFDYRFLEALRNHVQHRSTPVHSMGARELLRATTDGWADSFTLWANRDILEEEGDFKAQVLQEMPAKVDLRDAVRKYVTQLGEAHLELRAQVAPTVQAARTLVDEEITRYQVESGMSAVGLCACIEVDSDYSDWVPVFLEWDDVRMELVAKNQGIRIEVRPKERARP